MVGTIREKYLLNIMGSILKILIEALIKASNFINLTELGALIKFHKIGPWFY